ncbi:MAG: alpha-mannosidase [Balneola sp.]|jgi:predicted alpha-1,2-mannosidase|nr:alpha-mannosidase [Balneola sp.]MBE78556.1 alpha-mannosidase [Balneola sp.]|tara:strand:+ start:68068 stop:70335 length:2268 start_codon:yes stop_codon:yes gene_type:complete
MKRNGSRVSIISILFLAAMSLFSCSNYQNPNNFTDVFIGTGGHGHTYPGATVPFGMIQPGPVNGTEGWDWTSGYHYSDSLIAGFTQTHLSGTGIGDLNDILIQPVNGYEDFEIDSKYPDKPFYTSKFSHQYEKAVPGYYSVLLQDFDINAEMTATDRVAMYRFTYPDYENRSLIIDLGFRINWDTVDSSRVDSVDENTITGYRMSSGWAKDQRVYFAMEFSEPFKIGHSESLLDTEQDDSVVTRWERVQIDFKNRSEKILAKVAISSVSEAGALKNLSTLKEWDFDETRIFAEMAWQKELEQIKVTGGRDRKTKFYTALYHTKVAPVLYSDVDGKFRGGDGKVYQDSTYQRHTVFSLWDTFRAQHPLLTITNPDRVNDLINTMLDFYQETGYLPVWELHGNETNTMTGYHAVPVILDAYQKGYRGFDAELAFEAMKASAMQDHRDTDLYRKYQYVPSDLGHESVTKTLEYAYDDWCIAQMAFLLEKEAEYEHFIVRSGFWQNLYDEETKFMRGKTADGNWITPFDPLQSIHNQSPNYTEGNAWQHSWFVPHDVERLINKIGGDKAFISRLDSMFNMPSVLTGEDISPDISGMIGQYAHGNEPSHHIAYLYNFAGAPWKTQKLVSQIMDSLYTIEPDGLTGNEDAGQMSAWYVLSSMGFYPVNPANSVYVLGSPRFEEVEITLPGEKSFNIRAEKLNDQNVYIQSVKLNGESLQRSYITHAEVVSGGELIFEMGSSPNKEWAKKKDQRPPNMVYNN